MTSVEKPQITLKLIFEFSIYNEVYSKPLDTGWYLRRFILQVYKNIIFGEYTISIQ